MKLPVPVELKFVCLETNLEPELNRARSANGEHAGAEAGLQADGAVSRRGAVHRTRRAVEDAAQQLRRPVKVGVIEEVVKRYLRFDGQPFPLADWLDRPTEAKVKREEVGVPQLTCRGRLELKPRVCCCAVVNRVQRRSDGAQLLKLSAAEQSRAYECLASWS